MKVLGLNTNGITEKGVAFQSYTFFILKAEYSG